MLKSTIDPNYCYRELGESNHIVDHFNSNIETLEMEQHFGFDMALVPEEIYMNEKVISSLSHKIKCGVYIKLNPYRNYNWHQDAERNVSINLLLTPNIRYHTLFGKSTESEDQMEFIEMTYKPNTFYLFNNQISHSVINFDEPRYLFSLQFEENGLTYENFLR
jgi:hypothetical protein